MKGDFLGFSFKTGDKLYKSEDLGIIRVSDGSRYKDQLIPEIEDKTVEIPGMDGSYFYGSNFKSRNFSISIAFDDLKEEQLREIRQAFGYKHTGELIFEEAPYKKYLVKVASPPELEYICFDEPIKTESDSLVDGIRIIRGRNETTTIPALGDGISDDTYVYTLEYTSVSKPLCIRDGEAIELNYSSSNNTCTFEEEEEEYEVTLIYDYREKITPYISSNTTRRVYKGEGTIEFVAYYPFAKQVAKVRSAFVTLGYNNIDEWWNASGLLDSYSGIDTYSGGTIEVYNPGDVETGFRLYIPFVDEVVSNVTNKIIPACTIEYVKVGIDNSLETLNTLHLAKVVRTANDTSSIGIQINTVNGLVEGVYSNTNDTITQDNLNSSLLTSGFIFNDCATGEFFKLIPQTKGENGINERYQIKITFSSNNNLPATIIIDYDYLYF